MLRKRVRMDGSEWYPKIGVSCLRCKKRGEVCYWALELKRLDGACYRCKGMKACRVEEELQSTITKWSTIQSTYADTNYILFCKLKICGRIC